MNDKEKIEEAIQQIDDLLPELSKTKEKWIDESVDERRLILDRHSLQEKSEFLGALITDLENMKKTLEQ